MADQHTADIPAAANTLASDVPNIKGNLEWHKDVFEVITGNWSNTDTTNIVPYREVSTLSSSTIVTVSPLSSTGIRRVTIIADKTVDNNEIKLLFNSDTGANYAYYVRGEYDGTAASVYQLDSSSATYILLGGNTPADSGTYLIEFIFSFSPGDNRKVVVNYKSSFRNVSGNYYGFAHGMGYYNSLVAPVTSYSVLAGGGLAALTGKLLHERLA